MSDPGDPEGRHRQVFRDENARDQTHRFLPRLATAGLTPEILELTDTQLVTREGVPFHNWWRVADNSSRADMRPLVLELVRSMHALGICHRDLHDRNLVLRREDETPLVIDLELACDVDPSGACYDLDGPTLAIPVPGAHVRVGGAFAAGVWWGSTGLGGYYTALGEIFGPYQG